jgi:hypothetical protein
MKFIQGIQIEEGKDLGYNLQLLRDKLAYRLSFWNYYQQGLGGIAKSLNTKRVNWALRSIYFIILLPKFISHQFSKSQIARKIVEAENELIAHYKLPETKVKKF